MADAKTRTWRTLAIGVGAVLALAACSKDAPPPSAAGASGASVSVGESAGASGSSDGEQVGESASPSDPGGGGGSSGNGGSDGEDTQGAEDDLKVFAFATTDEATLAQQVVKVGQSLSQIEQDAKHGDLNALQQDAAALEQRANKLEREADDDAARQKPLEPADGTLRDANATADQAFTLTSSYARVAAIVAGQAADPNPHTLDNVIRQIGTLVGQQDEILVLYDDLNQSLATWSNAHPLLAAQALATYGG